MPSINRIRVNNVKYNFGTQFYDDFTMRMYGKNTLYDLANGGGKSVLMLLLLQNLIPNCTLDDKQPIEKLFRAGSGNTTIHSLIEWKMDPVEITEGYRYMTTGFCARKSKDPEDGTISNKDVASIDYFNYCIMYRDYNKNDIVNLPLIKEGERISYQALRNYLKDLEHRDMGLKVMVFDKKGEYQRFISGFGLHESQWEIVRGINKTEGHVRTYFETNYKTTRKVVEDLLIEEIIEKAFMVKTERDETGNDSMARMLMDIKEQLTILAKKKKDISNFDHQVELVNVLSSRVSSFLDIYQEQYKLTKILGDIYVTGKEYADNDNEMVEALAKEKDEKISLKNDQRHRMECLKVSKDKRKLDEYKEAISKIEAKISTNRLKLKELKEDLSLKESINEYVEYLSDKKKYDQYEDIIKAQVNEGGFNRDELSTIVYNIKVRSDIIMTQLFNDIEATRQKLEMTRNKTSYEEKLLSEAKIQLGALISSKTRKEEELANLSEKLSSLRMTLNKISFNDVKVQINENDSNILQLETVTNENSANIEIWHKELGQLEVDIKLLNREIEEKEKVLAKLERDVYEYQHSKEQLDNIKTVYNESTEAKLVKVIQKRIISLAVDMENNRNKLADLQKEKIRLEDNRLFKISDVAKKIVDYIETRHGVSAMFGMDYLSALPKDKKEQLLNVNPLIPYSVLVKDFAKIQDDPHIFDSNVCNVAVYIFDMDRLDENAIIQGENAISICATKEYLLNESTKEKLLEENKNLIYELQQQSIVFEEMEVAYTQDLAFVLKLSDIGLLVAIDDQKCAFEELEEMKEEVLQKEEKLKELNALVKKAIEVINNDKSELTKLYSDGSKLLRINEITEVLEGYESTLVEDKKEIARLEGSVEALNIDGNSKGNLFELESKLKALEKQRDESKSKWENTYKPYFIEGDYKSLSEADSQLETRFNTIVSLSGDSLKAIDDKKALMETLDNSMRRILKSIESKGVSISRLNKMNELKELFLLDDTVLHEARKNIGLYDEEYKKLSTTQSEINIAYSKLDGSIEYAIQNIINGYGSFVEENASMSEIIATLESGEELLVRLTKEAKDCEAQYKQYMKEQGYMLDLFKDVKRIVDTCNIDLSRAVILDEGKEKLRELFEINLLKFDKSNKILEKSKNELVRYKSNTAETLMQMSMFELANTIREDVTIPVDYQEAKKLLENLDAIVQYINLEKERVEKSLGDMETIKSTFEDQCIQRCLDVKTELDKLPKLSKIVINGESIQMVGLAIPYIKDEFIKPHMSAYIDKIVKQADSYNDDKDRMKYIRNCLTLKKLFGVIVTDMNNIKLSLYKRERIKEQSRYLKYEEAVGSTGQSQGIYIQFLISIINYISGMYAAGEEDLKTKTIFIDNPFGAAKDVYIWEPIFALLKANNVQLIVPARGATPAITGRFDVNYILGQKLFGGKQLTVVADYTSNTDQEELEYHDLGYEQVSFDFI